MHQFMMNTQTQNTNKFLCAQLATTACLGYGGLENCMLSKIKRQGLIQNYPTTVKIILK